MAESGSAVEPGLGEDIGIGVWTAKRKPCGQSSGLWVGKDLEKGRPLALTPSSNQVPSTSSLFLSAVTQPLIPQQNVGSPRCLRLW